MPMVRPCGDLAHTSYGVFIPNPLGKTAAKKYWPFHESAARAQHKWGSDDSFCRSSVPFARPLELRSAGDRLSSCQLCLIERSRPLDPKLTLQNVLTESMSKHANVSNSWKSDYRIKEARLLK